MINMNGYWDWMIKQHKALIQHIFKSIPSEARRLIQTVKTIPKVTYDVLKCIWITNPIIELMAGAVIGMLSFSRILDTFFGEHPFTYIEALLIPLIVICYLTASHSMYRIEKKI